MRYILYGIKGSGLSSLAHILLDKGYEVEGIDTNKYVYTQDDLIERKIKIYSFGEYIFSKADILIYGHSFKENEEVKKASLVCKMTYEYHEYVDKLIKESKLSIAVAGSHGKTFTTGLISNILSKLYNVSYLIGDGEGKYNGNDIFVFEACEYQDHFLKYKVDIGVILNIDYDHVDYFKSEEDYIESFNKFCSNCKTIILNKEDYNIKKLNHNNPVYFSFNDINNLKLTEKGYVFNLENELIKTNVYGNKHILNILSLIKLCDCLNIDRKKYLKYICEFNGVKRRFREIIINGDIYIDDYAHHPSQIKYTLEMIKNKYPDRELVVFFKPDRASRFLTFYKQIATSLDIANLAVIMEFKEDKDNTLIDLLLNENKIKFYRFNDKTINIVKNMKNIVVVSLSSKNMEEVYEKIFINPAL